MDSSPISTADLLHPAASFKLRLLCSYGGHIIPRPHDKSLVYSGGETHIVGIDRRTVGASLSYLTSHLSKVYYNNRSFVLKYLLPDGDLDALISVTNDDDLQIMIEEQDRLAASPNHSRIRLFLFPSETVTDQKAEAWFLDALRSVSISQRGKSVESALNSGSRDTSSDVSSPGSACEAKYCSDLASVPETMVLETSSSIGSNGSSASNPNFGSNDIHTEETGFHSAEYRIVSPSPGSFDSENSSIASVYTHTQSPTYHDPVPQVQSMGTLVFPSSCESGGHETQYWVQTPKDPSTPSCPNLQSDQSSLCQQQEIRYISASPSLVSQYPSGPFYPVYYSTISPQQQQQQQQQQQNQHPLYLSSVRSTTQVYNVPMQCSLVDPTNPNSQSAGSSIHHPHATVLSPSFTYKEVGSAIIPTELSAKVYMPVASGSAPSHFHMASNQNVPLPVNVSEMASHPIASASANNNACENTDDDDLLYTTTMYKTQPSAQLLQQYYAVNQGAMGSRQTSAEYSQHKIANLQM